MKQTTLKEKKALVQFVKQTLHSLVDEPSYQKLRKHITKKTFHSLQSLCKLWNVNEPQTQSMALISILLINALTTQESFKWPSTYQTTIDHLKTTKYLQYQAKINEINQVLDTSSSLIDIALINEAGLIINAECCNNVADDIWYNLMWYWWWWWFKKYNFKIIKLNHDDLDHDINYLKLKLYFLKNIQTWLQATYGMDYNLYLKKINLIISN